MNTILTVNKNSDHSQGSLDLYYTVFSDAAFPLDEIDVSKIEIKTIVDYTGIGLEPVREGLHKNIQALKDEGYMFLNIDVLTTLLLNQGAIPKQWIPLADTDALHTSGIEFLGTVLKSKEYGTLRIPNIGFARGVWDIYYTDYEPVQLDIDALKTNQVTVLRQAAVYLMK